jgi:signal transduction histidine kinase
MTEQVAHSQHQVLAPRRYIDSVGTRLAFATAVLVLIMSGAMYYALIHYEQVERLRVRHDAALMVARLFAELTSAAVEFGDDRGISDSLGYLRSNEDVTQAAVFALSSEGKCGLTLATWLRTPAQSPITCAPPAHGAAGVLQTSDALDASHWVADPSGRRIAVVAIRFSLERENRAFAALRTRLLQISLTAAAVLTLLLLLLARVYIIAPLRVVHAAVRELSAGTGTSASTLARNRQRLPLEARDEIGELARGFANMADAIARREEAIAAQNHDMRLVLSNVGEGFLVLDARGVIEGQRSAILETWFGAVKPGQALWDYLRPFDPDAAEWLELTWGNIGAASMPLALCLEQLPKTFSANERSYQVDYHPLRADRDQLDKMVVVIDDITALREREQAESQQRELVAVFTTLMRDRTGFISLCEDAKTLLKNMSEATPPAAYDLLEHLHTIKGNAHLFQLREFAQACELVEESCSDGKRLPSADDAKLLSHALACSIGPVAPFIALDNDQSILINRRDYTAIVQAIAAGERSSELLSRLALATAEPAQVVFGRFAERLQVLARRLAKCPVHTVVEPGDVAFPRQRFEALWSTTVHVIRNIADHALERPWEREQSGKTAEATVVFRARVAGERLYITFIDDGRGVDWEKVRERAAQQGWPAATRSDLVAALLGHGFSTAVATSSLSGRGVGLSALHAEVVALGGTLTLDSETGRGTTLHIDLPASLLLGSRS